MATRPEPIIFNITEKGRQVALDAEENGVTLKLKFFAVGGASYAITGNETRLKAEHMRTAVVSGGIEPNTKTLRFSATLKPTRSKDIYEVGLITDNDELFAIAASEADPLFSIHANISFVASFGLSLNDLNTSHITVVTDTKGSIAAAMMQDHLSSPHPHEQYLLADDLQPILDKIKELEESLEKSRVKVGGILTTSVDYADSAELSEAVGYGEWELYAEGRTLVGVSTLADDPEWKKTIGNEFGEDEHTLTIDETPSHVHQTYAAGNDTGGAYGLDGANYRGSPTVGDTMDAAGGDQPHNNVQKSKVVAHWIRVA